MESKGAFDSMFEMSASGLFGRFFDTIKQAIGSLSQRKVEHKLALKRPPESGQLVSESAELSLDLPHQTQQRVELESLRDALYLGNLNLGSPDSQPIKVAFDTGSEFLVVTSVFCADETSPESYRFNKVDKMSGKAKVESNGEKRCLNKAYNMTASKSAHIKSDQARRVEYGSADLQGFQFEDYACL
jgi:hypothetical protein